MPRPNQFGGAFLCPLPALTKSNTSDIQSIHTRMTHQHTRTQHFRGGRLKHRAPHQKSLRRTHTNVTRTARSNCVSTNFSSKQHPPLHFSVSFLGKNVSFHANHTRDGGHHFSTVPFFTQSIRARECVVCIQPRVHLHIST